MAKNTTQGKDPEITETPQNTPDTENQGATPKEETPKAETPKGKVYKFVSENKYLTCSSVGVQFINGKAETSSLEVAKVLATLSGVTLVED
jgi:hypothetical protein